MTQEKLGNAASRIDDCIVSNGRVITDSAGESIPESYEEEFRFEAAKRGFTNDEIREMLDLIGV